MIYSLLTLKCLPNKVIQIGAIPIISAKITQHFYFYVPQQSSPDLFTHIR